MKKILCLIVILTILLVIAVGCGNKESLIKSEIPAENLADTSDTSDTTESVSDTTSVETDMAEQENEDNIIDDGSNEVLDSNEDDAEEDAEEDAEDDSQEDSKDSASDSSKDSLSSDEPLVIKILEGVYIEPKEPHAKVGQEIVFVNQPVEGKKDKQYTLVGDSNDFYSSEVMSPFDQFSHTYYSPGVYTVKISPGGAFKVYVEE